MRPSLFALVCTLALACAVPALAQEDPHPAVAPTLTGETLQALTTVTLRVNCEPDGSGVVSYRTTGIAVGPYPGRFAETGGMTIASGPAGTSILTGFRATFTILSEVGTVTGTKSLVRGTRVVGTCTGDTASFANILLTYQASIETRTGLFRDRGFSRATLQAVEPDQLTLNESFVSSLATAAVVLDPPGNSFPIQPGRGCGDENHFHEDMALCAVPEAVDVDEVPTL